MDKQMIEEMARTICGRYNNGGCEVDGYVCNYKCTSYEEAQRLYNAKCRIIPENAVVMTSDVPYESFIDLLTEFDEMGFEPTTLPPPDMSVEEYTAFYKNKLLHIVSNTISKARKEMAEKFAEKFKEKMKSKYQGTGLWWTEIVLIAIETCKEITEGK